VIRTVVFEETFRRLVLCEELIIRRVVLFEGIIKIVELYGR